MGRVFSPSVHRASVILALLFGLAPAAFASPPPHGGQGAPGAGQSVSAVWREATHANCGIRYQGHAEASSPVRRVRLSRWADCKASPSGKCYFFTVQREADHITSGFRLANLTFQVDAVTVLAGNEAAVLGRAGGLGVVTLAALPSGRSIDSFVAYWPVISPSLRYVAYVKWFPQHIGCGYSLTDEYLLYDLRAPPRGNRPSGTRPSDVYDVGWPMYPPGARNAPGDTVLEGSGRSVHAMASHGFFWLGPQAVACVDRWHGVNSLVVADLSAGGRRPQVVARPIEASGLVDFASCASRVAPSDLARWKRTPGVPIYVEDIRKIPDKPDWVRLTLQPNACLTRTVVDMPIGPH